MTQAAAKIKGADATTTAIAEYSATEAALATLRARLTGAQYEVTTTAGMDTAKKDRRELVTLRTDLEKERQRIKAPALERCRLIDAEAKRITSELLTLEQPIDAQIKAEEERKAAIKAEKERIERERIAFIRERITKLQNLPIMTVGMTSADLEIFIARVEAQEIGEDFAEFQQEALTAKAETVAKLKESLAVLVAAEEEAARIKAEQEAEAARLEALRIDALRKEAIQKKIQAIRDIYVTPATTAAEIEALVDKHKEMPITEEEYQEFWADAFDTHQRLISALCKLHGEAVDREEHAARMQAEREELDRLRREDAERRRIAEEKAAAEKAEADRIAAEEQARIDAERAEIQRQQDELKRKQEEAEAEAERQRIAKAEAEAAEAARIAQEKAHAEEMKRLNDATADQATTLRSILATAQDESLTPGKKLTAIIQLAKLGLERGAK